MSATRQRLGQVEFVALAAFMFATLAISVDAMLPALPQIGRELVADAPERAALVVQSFMLGMGLGTFLTGPLSDAFGRRIVIQVGTALYMIGAVLAWAAQSFELLLIARVVQGLGSAGPRVAIVAVMRDQYSGREMARLMSFVMMVFTLVPAMAPAIGAVIINVAGWRAIFAAFVVFSFVIIIWFSVRQPETLPPEDRRPMTLSLLKSGAREVFSNRLVSITITIQLLVMSILFMTISSVQQIMDQVHDRADSFPIWFAVVALLAGTTNFANALLVGRLGMRRLVRMALMTQLVLSSAMLLGLTLNLIPDAISFGLFIVWAVTLFGTLGFTIGNLNALSMEPLGHIAGMAASMIGAVSTVGSVVLSVPVSLAFNGTTVPLALGVFISMVLANVLIRKVPV